MKLLDVTVLTREAGKKGGRRKGEGVEVWEVDRQEPDHTAFGKSWWGVWILFWICKFGLTCRPAKSTFFFFGGGGGGGTLSFGFLNLLG